MPNNMTRGLTNAYRDGHKRVVQEHSEGIIEMTFRETLPDVESRDAAIRICQVAFREEKRLPIVVSMTTDGENLRIRYGSMTYRPHLMQLADSTTFKWSPASQI
jgi:methionine synthase I (cobalamin-dependent)